MIRAVFLLLVGGSGVLGWYAPAPAWLPAPLTVLVGVSVGEAHRLAIRRRCRGASPATISGTPPALHRPITTTDLAILRYELACPQWSGSRLRVAHLSDLHVNDRLPVGYFQDVMARVAAEQPDLILYTGDFISKGRFIPLLADILSMAHGRLGTYAILGNHDHWANAHRVIAALRQAGVTLLGNSCQRLETEANGSGVLLCGCELPWGKTSWRPPAVPPGDLALMLTHTADNIYRLNLAGAHAVFAGHYHAGQIQLPLLGSLVVPSRYGRRFDRGHFVIAGSHLFVSAGVGASSPPYRIYCPPDVIIVDFRGGA